MSRTLKWSVRKRDGVWVALDKNGDLQYANQLWTAALSYALMASVGKTPVQMRSEEILRSMFSNQKWYWEQ